MPTYSYACDNCNTQFELFFYIKDYTEHPNCTICNSSSTYRRYADDVLSQNCSVKKSDNELKTIGDLALRNSERMSEDEKIHLYNKHNAYKYDHSDDKPLPTGMSRMKKQPKPKWPSASKTKHRRKTK